MAEELVCTNCGNDLACEGYLWCSDCMEDSGLEEPPTRAQ